jgi:uncharacterized protein YuzE
MQVTYDPEVDILNLRLKDDKVVESEYLEYENVVIDYNEKDEIVALEIMDWSKRNSLSLPLVGILFKRSA